MVGSHTQITVGVIIIVKICMKFLHAKNKWKYIEDHKYSINQKDTRKGADVGE